MIMFTKKHLFNLIPFLFIIFVHALQTTSAYDDHEFASTRGTQFVMKGEPFYPNGFNAYWLMQRAASTVDEVSMALQQASELGLNVVRTWAFSDGGYNPLQYSPGSYDQAMFQGLDFVIAEAKRYGIYVILSLVNSHEDFGGRKQYVEWARELDGQRDHLTSDDDFYTNHVVKGYYKNHVKTVLTRINTITGIAYKDEPIIFAWELINEPRCPTDLSGKTLQGWIVEMAAYVKSIDSNHLLEVGLEGFYGESMPGMKQFNPNDGMGEGSDFISNNGVPGIDFATIHAYPDQWIPESDDDTQLSFLRRWIMSHIHDAAALVRKPLVIAEFGKSSSSNSLIGGYSSTSEYGRKVAVMQRDAFYASVYNMLYASARAGGSCSGGLFWQLLLGNRRMDELRDGYEMVVSETPSTANIIARHSRHLRNLNQYRSRRA